MIINEGTKLIELTIREVLSDKEGARRAYGPVAVGDLPAEGVPPSGIREKGPGNSGFDPIRSVVPGGGGETHPFNRPLPFRSPRPSAAPSESPERGTGEVATPGSGGPGGLERYGTGHPSGSIQEQAESPRKTRLSSCPIAEEPLDRFLPKKASRPTRGFALPCP